MQEQPISSGTSTDLQATLCWPSRWFIPFVQTQHVDLDSGPWALHSSKHLTDKYWHSRAVLQVNSNQHQTNINQHQNQNQHQINIKTNIKSTSNRNQSIKTNINQHQSTSIKPINVCFPPRAKWRCFVEGQMKEVGFLPLLIDALLLGRGGASEAHTRSP